jgi:hypothetical protein
MGEQIRRHWIPALLVRAPDQHGSRTGLLVIEEFVYG